MAPTVPLIGVVLLTRQVIVYSGFDAAVAAELCLAVTVVFVNVAAKLPVPVPVTSPVKVMV